MRTNEVIREIEENGGLNVRHLRSCYNDDVRNHHYRGSFNGWVTVWLMHSFYLSRYAASKVAKYYL